MITLLAHQFEKLLQVHSIAHHMVLLNVIVTHNHMQNIVSHFDPNPMTHRVTLKTRWRSLTCRACSQNRETKSINRPNQPCTSWQLRQIRFTSLIENEKITNRSLIILLAIKLASGLGAAFGQSKRSLQTALFCSCFCCKSSRQESVQKNLTSDSIWARNSSIYHHS